MKIQNNAAFSSQTFLVGLALIIYPASVLAIPNINGLIFVYFIIAGISLILRNHLLSSQPSRNDMLFYFSVSLFALIGLFASINSDFDFAGSKKFLHFLFLIPIYIYLRHTGIKLKYLWYGLVLGSFIAASIATYEVLIQGIARAKSLTHPIIFGDLSLVMGFMSLAGIGWFKSRAKWQLVLPIIAVLCGLTASILSGARGGWIAVPFLLILFFWYIKQHFSLKQKLGLIAISLCVLSAVYLIPQTNVSKQIDRSINSIQLYVNSSINSKYRSSSIGTRFEMWQASINIYLDNPLLGIGWGNYQHHAKLLVDKGLRHPSAASYPHPHNQFISALVNGGTLAFIGLILLFAILSHLFILYIKQSKSRETQRLALAGLVLIVSFICFGLSEAMFERSRPTNFFAFYLAVIMAAIYGQQNLMKNVQYYRKHKLTVTIITKDEEDRIEDCLKSVSNWADEIIVLDSGSTDNTIGIAKKYTDKIFETDWPGYGLQKQRALEKASSEWVLSIDADERVSNELRNDIDEVLSQETPDCSGYQTPWAVILYNHRMDFGRSARAPLRLFKREGAHFTDSQIHERIILAAPQTMRKLNGRLLHLTHRDYGHGLFKSGNYAWLSSQKYFAENRWGGGLIGATLRAAWTFILIYFLRLGLLDGSAGFLSAMSYSQNSFNKYAGLWSLKREERLKKNKY